MRPLSFYFVLIVISSWTFFLINYDSVECKKDPDEYTKLVYPRYETTISYCSYAYQQIVTHSTYEELDLVASTKMYYRIPYFYEAKDLVQRDFYTHLSAYVCFSCIGIGWITMHHFL